MPPQGSRDDHPFMESFAVLWSESDTPARAGKLQLEPNGLTFEGPHFDHHVYYEDIEAVRVARNPAERLAGRPALVVNLAVGGPLRIGSLEGVGVLTELAERLGHLTATHLFV
jgi:hypothetical protein